MLLPSCCDVATFSPAMRDVKLKIHEKVLITFIVMLLASHFCSAQNVLSEQQQQELRKISADLLSNDEQKRNLAADTLNVSRGILVQEVVSALNVALKGDKSQMKIYDSSFARICEVVEKWRIEEATGPGLLLDYIDFTLDPKSFPVGGFMANRTFYPAATALVATRTSRLNNDLLLVIRYPIPIGDNKLQVATWILQESNGNKMAQLVVEHEIADTERWMKNAGETENVGRESLLKALKLLQAEGGVQLPSVEMAPEK